MTAGKTEVVEKVARMLDVSHRAALGYVSAVVEAQMEALAEHGELTMRGFGTFRVREIAESRARNPATGETIAGPSHRRVRFKAGAVLRDRVSGRR